MKTTSFSVVRNNKPTDRRARRRLRTAITRASMRVVLESLEQRIFLSAGQLDETYNFSGVATASGFQETASVMQPDGKIVAVGFVSGTKDIVGLARFNPDGSVDKSFGNNGFVSQDVVYAATDESVTCVALENNGEIVVGGNVRFSSGEIRFMIAGFTSSGAFDTSFAYGGSNSSVDIFPDTSEEGPAVEQINAMMIDSSNEILVVGNALNTDGSREGVVVKYNSNGIQDTSFGTGGYRLLQSSGGSFDGADAITSDAGGGIFIAGEGSDSFAQVAVIDGNGNFDANIGSGGIATFNAGGSGIVDAITAYHDPVAGNVVLLAGSSLDSLGGNMSIVRLLDTSNGLSLDTSFGTGGAVQIPATAFRASADSANAKSIAVQSDGKIVIAGSTGVLAGEFDTAFDFAVARLQSDGGLDSSFGSGGLTAFNIYGTSDVPSNVMLDGDGMIYIAGSGSGNGAPPVEVARLQPGEYPFDGAPYASEDTIQAEDFDNGGQGAGYSFINRYQTVAYRVSGVSIFSGGTGYIVGNFDSGEYLQYSINLSAGVYQLHTSYASALSNPTFSVSFDNGAVSTATLAPPSTGGWGTYAPYTTPNITLSAGMHTMRVTAPGSALNFDYFSLVPAPGSPTVKITSAPDITSSTQGKNYQFTVNYTDTVPINVSTIGNANMLVTGPKGYSQLATVVSKPSSDTTSATVTYQITSPGSSWAYTDDGAYNIALQSGQVKDENGAAVGGGHLGPTPTFKVTLPLPYGSIAGYVYVQTTSGSIPIAGATVYLDLKNVGSVESGDPRITTGSNGQYTFSNLTPGTDYYVRQTPPYSFVESSPSSGVIIIALGNGQISTGNNFTDAYQPYIEDFTPYSGNTPRYLQPGTTVTINGAGLIPGTLVKFGAELDTATPTSYSPNGTSLKVTVPKLATSGTIEIINPLYPQTTTSTGVFSVNSFRNIDGFQFANSFSDGTVPTTLGEVSDLFGYDAAHAYFDPCWPFDFGQLCRIYVDAPSAVAQAFIDAVQDDSSDGQCFGMSLAASRFLEGDALYQTFENDVFNTDGLTEGNINGALVQYIHEQHIAQDSEEALSSAAADDFAHILNDNNTAIYNEITGDLKSGKPVLTCFSDFGGGHCVLAYNVEGTPSDFYIDVYDPNRPFDSSENSDAQTHESEVDVSRIHVVNNQWSFSGDFAEPSDAPSNWSSNWSGGFGDLTFTPYGTIPLHPSIPGQSALGVLLPFGGATVTQISDSSGHDLLNADGSMNTNAKTALPGSTIVKEDMSDSPPIYVLGENGVTETLHSTGSDVTETMMQDGFAVDLLDDSDPSGTIDKLTFQPASSTFGFTTSAAQRALDAELITTGTGGFQRTATFSTTSFANAGDSVGFNSSDDIVVKHYGTPTTFSLTLTQPDTSGNMQTFSTGAIKLATGDSVNFAPSDWFNLNTTTTSVVITHSNGTKTSMVLKNAAPGVSPTVVEGKIFNGTIGSFVPPNTSTPSSAYSVTINWDDGQTSTGALSADQTGGYDVTGSHTYSDAGYYSVSYQVKAGGVVVSSATVRFAVTEAAIAITPVAIRSSPGEQFSGVVATIQDANTLEKAAGLSALVNWGDGSSSTGTVTETSAGEFSVSGTHTYNKGGNFTTLVTITDGASIVSETTVLKVTKTTFSGTLGAVPLPIPGLPLSDFVGTIAWGDGTSSAALMSLMSGDGIDFSGNHTYDKTGTYTATLQLKGGYMVSAKSTATVNAAGGTISGTVFNDANGNGARNTGEGGVANRVIYIDSNKDGILDNNELHTTTDAAGNWSFTGLAAGTYRIREQNIAGVRHTDPPGNSNYYDLKVTTGSVIQGILFGDQVYTPNPAPILAINAGGPSFVLNSGITYSADTGFTGGTATTTVLDVGNTDNDPIYYSYRSGTSFSYSLAVPNGAYNLVLNFVDPTSTAAGQRKFNVTVEGKQVLTNFDIFAAAGPKTAISKAFAVTVTGGKLTLSLKSVVGNAILSGIVLYPT